MDDEVARQPCPRCAASLAHVRREGQTLEVCTRCKGVWFDPGELTLLLEVYRRVDGGAGSPSTMVCPRCGAAMREVAFPGTSVLVDRCPGCQGVWLDGGELEALQATLREVGGRAPDAGAAGGGVDARALALLEEAQLEAGRRALCPLDGAALWSLRKDGHTVEQCSSCGGTWLDAGELTAVAGVYRRLDASTGVEGAVECLRCARRLRRVEFPGTTVGLDACPACNGVWLAKGGLEALRSAVGHLVRPEKDLKQRAEELRLGEGPAPERGCPRCGGALAKHPTRGVASERCGGCGGMWFDAGLLSICLGVSKKLRVEHGAATDRLCARCPEQRLVELAYPGTSVTIDLCPDCRATWLDAGKLEALLATAGR